MFSIWKWTLILKSIIASFIVTFIVLQIPFVFAVTILSLLYCQDYNCLWSGFTQKVLWCTKVKYQNMEKKLKSSLKPYKSHGLYLRIIEHNWKGFMKHWSSSLTRSSSFDCDFKSLIVITSLLKTFFTKRFKASRLVLLEYILI